MTDDAPTVPPRPFADRHAADEGWSFGTLSVHAGQEPDEATGSVSPPIYQTSTYAQDAVGEPRAGYEYARTANPTRERLERAVAALEGARHGIAFASGSACTATLGDLVAPGEEIVAGDDVYGGTFRYFDNVLRPRGVGIRFVDLAGGPDNLRSALSPQTRLVWFETPTNPLLKLVDIAGVADVVAGHRGAGGERPLIVVDNTFASPALQQPLDHGADVVFHSATKYLAGHSDTVNGVIVTSREQVAERLRFLQNAGGAVPGPFDCFLVLRGLRTLALRTERHAANGVAVARFLADRDDIDVLIYPGLADGRHAHPQAGIAARQMRLPGGMVSFLPRAGGRHGRTARQRAEAICAATRLFTLAESLGSVESLIEVPAVMTHASVAGSPLEIPEALVRLSCGIEAATDLIGDLGHALDDS
ncbi:MAG TPA: PLP-dependent transferase [Candidatus Limnocylindria bacterium]|nr:PLP-dependent transferase [Candidatus Limnocylindria bacterium]